MILFLGTVDRIIKNSKIRKRDTDLIDDHILNNLCEFKMV